MQKCYHMQITYLNILKKCALGIFWLFSLSLYIDFSIFNQQMQKETVTEDFDFPGDCIRCNNRDFEYLTDAI